jgi:hypothetical protein
MSNENNLVLPEQYAHRVTPFFASQEDFYKNRDEFYSKVKPELEELNEKRRRSEEAAQIKRYR